MTDKLTAVSALTKAEFWLDKAVEASKGDDTEAQSYATVAQAFSSYAVAYQLWNSIVDVRTTDGGR